MIAVDPYLFSASSAHILHFLNTIARAYGSYPCLVLDILTTEKPQSQAYTINQDISEKKLKEKSIIDFDRPINLKD